MCVEIIWNNTLVGVCVPGWGWRPATERVTLYCTWRPSALTTGLHGQVYRYAHALQTWTNTWFFVLFYYLILFTGLYIYFSLYLCHFCLVYVLPARRYAMFLCLSVTSRNYMETAEKIELIFDRGYLWLIIGPPNGPVLFCSLESVVVACRRL